MTSLRAGFVFRRPDPTAFLAAVGRAEQQGLETAWTTQGGIAPDALAMFAVAATQTERIGLGTAVVPTYPRHPTALASQAIVVSKLAGERFRLGIGPSHRPTVQDMFGLPMSKPLEHLRDYLTFLCSLLWEGSAGFDGAHFRVHARLPPRGDAAAHAAALRDPVQGRLLLDVLRRAGDELGSEEGSARILLEL